MSFFDDIQVKLNNAYDYMFGDDAEDTAVAFNVAANTKPTPQTTEYSSQPVVITAKPVLDNKSKIAVYPSATNGRMFNGDRYDDSALTAAHPTLPMGTQITVSNGREDVVVTITDRSQSRMVLSGAAARALDVGRDDTVEWQEGSRDVAVATKAPKVEKQIKPQPQQPVMGPIYDPSVDECCDDDGVVDVNPPAVPSGENDGADSIGTQVAMMLGADTTATQKVVKVESGGDASAKNPYSSAAGSWQITRGTMIGMAREVGDKYGIGELTNDIEWIKTKRDENGNVTRRGHWRHPDPIVHKALADIRYDEAVSTVIGIEYNNKNIEDVTPRIGRKPYPKEQYAMHFLGADDFVKLHRNRHANPDRPADEFLPRAAGNEGNRNIFYMKDADGNRTVPRTAQQLYNLLASKTKLNKYIEVKNDDIPALQDVFVQALNQRGVLLPSQEQAINEAIAAEKARKAEEEAFRQAMFTQTMSDSAYTIQQDNTIIVTPYLMQDYTPVDQISQLIEPCEDNCDDQGDNLLALHQN